jgi:GAF domain
MADDRAREILVGGVGAIAREAELGRALEVLLASIARPLGIDSAAIFVVDGQPDRLRLGAAHGVGEPAIRGLVAAVANPEHAIARTAATGEGSFDVLPTAPGGPALRSHLPLIVRRHDGDAVVGVLALAHQEPIDSAARPLVEAGADLAAVAIERRRT